MNFQRSIIIVYITRIILFLISFVLSLIIANTLGPEGNGIYATHLVIVTAIAQLGLIGLNTGNTYFISKNKKNLPNIIGATILLAIIATFSVIAIFYILINHCEFLFKDLNKDTLWIAILSAPLIILNLWVRGIFLGLRKIKIYSLVDLVNKFVYLAIVVSIYLSGLFSIKNLFLAFLCANIAAAIIHLYFLTKFPIEMPSFSLIKKLLIYSFKIYLAVTFGFLIVRSDIYLVNYLKGNYASGIYAVAAYFADVIIILPATVGNVFLPFNIASKNSLKSMIAVHRHIFIIMFIICSFIFTLSPFLIRTFFPQYHDSILPFMILLPAIFFFSLVSIFSQYYAGKNYPYWLVIIWFFIVLLNILLNIILIPKYNYLGAAFSSLISYFLTWIIMIIITKTKFKTKYKYFPRFCDILYIFNYKNHLTK